MGTKNYKIILLFLLAFPNCNFQQIFMPDVRRSYLSPSDLHVPAADKVRFSLFNIFLHL